MGFDKRQLADRGGFEVIVYKEKDFDTRPDDFDCYDAADIKAWHDDAWQYVTVVAEVFFEGVMVGDASIGGVEDGQRADENVNAYDHTLGGTKGNYDIPAQAIEAAAAWTTRLYEAVQAGTVTAEQ